MKNPLFFLSGLLFSFFSWQGNAQSYCQAEGMFTNYASIDHVIYAGIDNRDVYNFHGYNNYTNHVAYVHLGETNQIELWMSNYDYDYLYAYIDWNQNGSFTDAGEYYYFGYLGVPGPHRKQIVVPENAKLGNTRMRVRISDSPPGPCDTTHSGEVEDYTVNITPPATSTFITTWTTTTPNESITIPTNPSKTYSYSVSWENNGVWQNGFTGNATHTFPNPGTYTVAISGTFPAIYFNNSGDKDKIQSIEQWGTNSWTSMQGAFSGCTNVTYNASDVPDLSLVSNMASMFEDASSFNADLSSWDVSNVSTMENTFFLATSFNGDISTWNVGNVTNMKGLFAGTSIFNGDISNWDVSNVATMSGMFTQAPAFNQNIDGWNVSNVDDMEYMFYSATAFNQDLSSWDVSSVTQMNNMFFNTQLSTANYDALLNEWSTLTLQNGVTLDVGSVQYCDGSAARTGIIADFGWAINDGGLMVGCDPSDYFITTWKTDNPGTSNNTSIEITTAANEVYNYDVNWGDGSGWQIGITGNATHRYATAGTYTVSIRGTFPRILFETYSDREKILSIEQWGTNVWTSMERAFFECANLVSNAPDAPNLSAVTTTERMFERAFSFNGDLSAWDVSNITNMGSMFNSAISFNSTIGSWNVSNVTNMAMMFSNATSFNQDIRSWDVSSVTQMNNMFFNTLLSTANYDALLNEWSTLALQNGVTFDVGSVQYCTGLMARATIIADFGWTINDGGAQDGCGLSGHFVTTWKTDNAGTSNATSITIPTHPDEVYAYDVDWGDGNGWETGFTADATHTYTTEGTYTVSIRGTFPRIYFNNAGDKAKLLSIEEWGTIAWTSMESAFYGCANLIYNAFDAPNLSAVANTKNMFRNASSFNGNLSNWDMGSVSNMAYMFSLATVFNGNISTWNVSNVTNMEGMFNGAFIFNSDISNWDVSNVTNMNSLFNIALAFNGDISAWDVSNVITMNLIFSNAQAFNQDIGNWNVGNVNDMRYVFSAASNFNQYIGNWDVSNVAYMGGMFYYSSAFDQDLSNWNVSNVVDMSEMFDYTSLSRINYDLLLNGWSNLTLQNGVNFSAGSSQYCEGLTARARIISNFGWNITDGGQEDGCIMGDYFITTWQTTTPNESITIPTTGSGYDYSIDWGDGTVANNQTGNATHSYAAAGVYTVKILGDFPRIYFNNSGGRLKIKSIEQWGSNAWSSMEKAFDGCRYLVSNATDVPNLSGVTSTELMFRNCLGFNGDLSGWDVSSVTTMNGMFFANTTFNGDLSSWDVSNVTDMSYMFSGAIAFNQDISSWDVSNVTTMTNMFEFAYAFNQDIGGWNVANVTTMDYMFKYAEEFNQNIGAWNVGNVTSMVLMFYGAASFNQDIGNWNVANVTIMDYMFASASVFNQDIGAWNVGNVATTVHMFENALAFNQDISSWDVSYIYDMSYMFSNAIAFDQNLGGWNVENVIDMQEMFFNNTLSTANYDALLNGWSSQALQYNVVFNGGNSTYCAGEDARNLLLDTFGWNVLDAGRNCEDICETTTIYSASGWSNGFPDTTMIAVFNSDYNTTLGSLDACSIQIKPDITVTVSEGTTIKAVNDIVIDGNLIFLSSETGNGELAAMGATSTIIGEATVQRYMKNKRSYRMVSPAVTTTSSIHDNWQEGANSNTHNPNPGFGTHITGSTTDQMNGFDGTSTGNHSMFTVNVASQQFQVVANTDVNTLTAGNPYLLFVRGDRSIDLNDNNAAGETVLRATGALLTGTQIQNFATEDAGDFAMFGNPYQSAVDINSVLASSTNVKTGYYYVYDPSLGDKGAYVTVNLPAGTNTSSSAANQFLQPGQGGQFATLAAGTSSIVFNEGDKTPGEFTSTNRPLAGNDMLAVQLYTTENFNNGGPVHDSFGILFAEGNDNGLTPADAVKPFNFYENLGIDHEGTYLSLERREMPQEGEVYSLYSSGYSQTDYTLKIIVDGLEDSILYLDDNFTGTSTLLEIGETAYAFNVNASEPLSKATDRFSIRTEQRLGVADGNLLSGIRLYPNPLNADTFYINAPRLNGEKVMVSINDMSGRIIYDQILDCHSNIVTVPMDEKISSGVYLVSLKHGGDSNTFRLIIE